MVVLLGLLVPILTGTDLGEAGRAEGRGNLIVGLCVALIVLGLVSAVFSRPTTTNRFRRILDPAI